MTVEQIQAFCRREGVRIEVVGSLAGVSWLIHFDWEGRFSIKSVGLPIAALKPQPQQILDTAASITVTWWDPARFEKVLEAGIAERLS